MGPEGKGWYWPEEGCGQIGKPKAGRRSRTCPESCELTCGNLCKPKGDGDDGQVAANRYYGYFGYGRLLKSLEVGDDGLGVANRG